jgi:hypothetical protein
MFQMISILKNLFYRVVAFIEFLAHRDERYRYRIEDIEPGFRNGAPSGTIVYKQIGCRVVSGLNVSPSLVLFYEQICLSIVVTP